MTGFVQAAEADFFTKNLHIGAGLDAAVSRKKQASG
jgi:hypothetical protein